MPYQDLHLAQEYESPPDRPLYLAHIHYRTEEGPPGPDSVYEYRTEEGAGDTPAEAAKDALATIRRTSRLRITILSLHIARNRLRFFAAPLDLEEILAEERAKEKEAADGNG